MLDQFYADLAARFGEQHVDSKLLKFGDTDFGENYAQADVGGRSSTMVPVNQIITHNIAAEVTARSDYRLIVFPTNYVSAGVWRYYTIRWGLYDAHSGQIIWSYFYKGRHMVMLKDSENAEARSKKIIDAAFEQMKVAGLL